MADRDDKFTNAEGMPEHKGSTTQIRPDRPERAHDLRERELRDSFGGSGEPGLSTLAGHEIEHDVDLRHRGSTAQIRPDRPEADHAAKREELRETLGSPRMELRTETVAAVSAEPHPRRRRFFFGRQHPVISHPPQESIGEVVSQLSDGMNQLVRGHLALARVEMARDMKKLARDLGMEAAGAPPLTVGYLLLWFAIGYALALVVPTWAAFLICAAANFAIGVGLMLAGRAMMKRDKPQLKETTEEFRRDKSWLNVLKQPAETMRGHMHASEGEVGRKHELGLQRDQVFAPESEHSRLH
jgi:hypothetical protein